MTNPIPFDDPISPREVAEHLKRMRKMAGFTQQQAADRMRVGIGTIQAWESGVNLVQVCVMFALVESYGGVVVLKPPSQRTPISRSTKGFTPQG